MLPIIRPLSLPPAQVLTLTDTNEDTERPEAMNGEKPFSQLYVEVQPILSQMNRKNVSLPLAFVSILLLCNEKHLMLKPESELDFSVYQAPNPYK